MKTPKSCVVLAAICLSLIPDLVNAAPVRCYIGSGGTHRICDLRVTSTNRWLLFWPDAERTSIHIVNTPSGPYSEVYHISARNQVYGRGTRYLDVQGGWLCFYPRPGGRGGIDFCIVNPRR
nr:hypothetical protein [Arthrospira sp. PLM2.Bin9]